MRIRIAQCLCGPARHAILATAVGPSVTLTDAALLDGLRGVVQLVMDGNGGDVGIPFRMDPWCGLCGTAAHDWQYEIGWSREFPDWDAAQLALKQSESDQRTTAAVLELLDATYNARLRREMQATVDKRDQ